MGFYSGVEFWILLAILSIPMVIIGLREKNSKNYLLFVSLLFAILIYSSEILNLLSLFSFLIYNYLLIIYCSNRKKDNKNFSIISLVLLSLLPITISRIIPFFQLNFSYGFLGISYITFKVIQILIEIKDGFIEKIKFSDYLSFMLFFPTISSGPIDRSRRFISDLETVNERAVYIDMLADGLSFVIQGLVYKLVIAQLVFDKMSSISNRYAPSFLILYMYLYGFYLFFDFAGYSLMAVGVSKIFGINTPMNFNKPFLAKDMKDFWNRWHISLSHWFRDYVFSRLVLKMFKSKKFKSQLTIAMSAYIVDMSLMGIWHGLSFSYLIYGLYHGIILAITEWVQKKSKIYKRYKNNKVFNIISIFCTFNLVMFGFFIFSGRFTEVLIVIFKLIRG